jgi:hypothetical protein
MAIRDDNERKVNNETEPETLECLFQEVFDLVDERVARIPDIEVERELSRVLETADLVDGRSGRSSVEKLPRLLPWNRRMPVAAAELQHVDTISARLVKAQAEVRTARQAAEQALADAEQPVKATVQALNPASSQSTSTYCAPARAEQLRSRSRTRRMHSVLVAIAATIALVVGVGTYMTRPFDGYEVATAGDIALQIVYSPPAKNARIALPEVVKADLAGVWRQNKTVALTRVDWTGEVSTSPIYMPLRPRNTEVAAAQIARMVYETERTINERTIDSSGASSGGRALYAGLSRIKFRPVPTIIISGGLDRSSPYDYRTLKSKEPPQKVVAKLKKAGMEPAFDGPVIFVFVPPPSQDHLGEAEETYQKELWSVLLKSAGATSVAFLDTKEQP